MKQQKISSGRILIVDNDVCSRELLCRVLQHEGYECEVEIDGHAVHEKVISFQPDVLLLDVVVSDMDGFEVTRRLRQDEQTCHLPIILLALVNNQSFRIAGLEAGADEFIAKPVEPVELRMRLRNMLRLKRYQDGLQANNHDLKKNLSTKAVALDAQNKILQDAQSQLSQSEKMASLGQLAAGVAHEINNPVGYIASNMATMAGYVADLMKLLDAYQALESKVAVDAPELIQLEALKQKIDFAYLKNDIRDLIDECDEGVARVRSIVQDLKGFAHKGTSDWQHEDIHEALESTLNVVRNEIKYKAEIVKEYGDLPLVQCLPSELKQVWMNLLVNAAHAIEDHGMIYIRTGVENESNVWIEIEDTGAGIKAEHQANIFSPFFTTKPVGQGTGLGLSISHGIIKKHHGEISVESELGRGTRFRITLPVNHVDSSKQEAVDTILRVS